MGDEFQLEVRLEIPADRDGFFRRQCAACERQFKAHSGGHDPSVVTHFCPLCGTPESSGNEHWLTPEQEGFMTDSALADGLDGAIDEMLAGLENVTIKRTGSLAPDPPSPIMEPNDMSIVVSPCHVDEPIKVPEDLTGPFHCLVCGRRFAV